MIKSEDNKRDKRKSKLQKAHEERRRSLADKLEEDTVKDTMQKLGSRKAQLDAGELDTSAALIPWELQSKGEPISPRRPRLPRDR